MYRILFSLFLSRLDPENAHHLAFLVIRCVAADWPGRPAEARDAPARIARCRRARPAFRLTVRRSRGIRQGRRGRQGALAAGLRARRGRHDYGQRAAGQRAAQALPAHRRSGRHQPDGFQQPGRRGCRAAASLARRTATRPGHRGQHRQESRCRRCGRRRRLPAEHETACTSGRLSRGEREFAEYSRAAWAAGRRQTGPAA